MCSKPKTLVCLTTTCSRYFHVSPRRARTSRYLSVTARRDRKYGQFSVSPWRAWLSRHLFVSRRRARMSRHLSVSQRRDCNLLYFHLWLCRMSRHLSVSRRRATKSRHFSVSPRRAEMSRCVCLTTTCYKVQTLMRLTTTSKFQKLLCLSIDLDFHDYGVLKVLSPVPFPFTPVVSFRTG